MEATSGWVTEERSLYPLQKDLVWIQEDDLVSRVIPVNLSQYWSVVDLRILTYMLSHIWYDKNTFFFLQNIMQRKMLGVNYYSVSSQLNYLSALVSLIGIGIKDQLRLYR